MTTICHHLCIVLLQTLPYLDVIDDNDDDDDDDDNDNDDNDNSDNDNDHYPSSSLHCAPSDSSLS